MHCEITNAGLARKLDGEAEMAPLQRSSATG